VLDENDRHVSPGEVGRAVLTSLYNYATPFIRYEIGDYVRLGTGPCPCGRTLPVLTEILGRQRNMITLPDGKRMWLPGRALVAMAEFVPLRRMRFVQRSMTEFQLQYVPDESRRQPDAVGLSACATRLIHPGITIEALAVDSLPRSAGGKYEDVVGLA
jgi:phenylacetate-CoA ligase